MHLFFFFFSPSPLVYFPPSALSLRWNVRLHQHLAKLLQLLLASHFLHQQRHLDDVKVLGVKLLVLVKILALHLPAGVALLAVALLLGEQQLVDDDTVGVDTVVGQFLDHALRLVQAQELSDADAHKGGQLGVLELGVDLGNGSAQGLELLHHLVEVLAVGEGAVGAEEAVEQGAVLGGELGDLGEGLFEDGRELEETKGVAGGGGVEDDGLVGERLDLLEDFGEGHGFVNTGDLDKQENMS